MTRLIFIVLLMMFSLGAAAKEAVPASEDPVLEKRVMTLSKDLRCLVCQNESLADSRADLANDLRREIREQMKRGMSDQQIIDFLVQRYGDFVLYRPPVKSTTLVLWFGPLILLIAGSVVMFIYLRRRRARTSAEVTLSEQDIRRAEALLRSDSNGDKPC